MKNISEWINTIIEDLVDSSKKLSDTLFKVQVLAFELDNKSLQDWIKFEMTGYGDSKKPEYRNIPTAVYGNLIQNAGIRGIFTKKNTVLPIEEALGKDVMDKFNNTYLDQSIAEIEKMIKTEGNYRIDLPHFVIQKISEMISNWDVDDGWQRINKSSLDTILSTVKSTVLRFLLELNKELGNSENIRIMEHKKEVEGIFEKTIGTINGKTVNISIGNKSSQAINYGENTNMNVASGDNVSQTVNPDIKNEIKEFIQILKGNLEQLELDSEDKEDILNEVNRVETQIERDTPKFSIINSAMSSIQGILTGITANAFYPIVMEKMSSLMNLLG